MYTSYGHHSIAQQGTTTAPVAHSDTTHISSFSKQQQQQQQKNSADVNHHYLEQASSIQQKANNLDYQLSYLLNKGGSVSPQQQQQQQDIYGNGRSSSDSSSDNGIVPSAYTGGGEIVSSSCSVINGGVNPTCGDNHSGLSPSCDSGVGGLSSCRQSPNSNSSGQHSYPSLSPDYNNTVVGQLPLDIIDTLPGCHGNSKTWRDTSHIDTSNKIRNFEPDPVTGTPTSYPQQQQTHCNSQVQSHMNGHPGPPPQSHLNGGSPQGPGMLDILCHKSPQQRQHNTYNTGHLQGNHHQQQQVPPQQQQQPHGNLTSQHGNTGTHGNLPISTQQHMISQQQQQQQHNNNPYCLQLPDSPPDSGSEPYSPPNGDHQNNTDHNTNLNYCNNVKSGMQTSMPGHQQQAGPGMYMPPGMGGGGGGPGGGGSTPHSSITPPHTQISPISNMSSNPHTAHMHQRTNGYNNGYMPPIPPNMGGEPPKLNHQPPIGSVGPITLNPQMLPYNVGTMNNLANHPNKKRKYESPTNTVTPAVLNSMGIPPGVQPGILIKHEPGMLPDCDDDGYAYDLCSDMSSSFLDGSYQVIKWQVYQAKTWATLLDHSYKPLPSPSYRVDADKGFNFAGPDDAFVCQKKNHFQVTVHMELHGHAKYVKAPDGDMKPVDSFQIHFHGVKLESASQTIKIQQSGANYQQMESATQTIKVEQSQSDRSKRPFYPVRVDLTPDQVSKITVGRLHFSETTTNNMRKKGKPNPDQRYFMLVVSLHAHSGEDHWLVAAQVSERIIVRASNPGQFDQDVDVTWQKGHTSDTVYHAGRVGINTDRPDESLTVHGNVKLTGHVVQPSDRRIKTDIREIDPKVQLKNISSIKVYNYGFDNKYSDMMGMAPDAQRDTGVLAQELREVLPDAVKETGDLVYPDGEVVDNLQVVNKDRIYMENVGAVKELCKVTDKLENRINELETMNKKLNKLGHYNKGSIKSTCSTMSLSTCSTISRTSSIPRLTGSKLEKEFGKDNGKDKDMKELQNIEKRDMSEKSDKKSHSHHHHHHHRHHRHHSRGPPVAVQEEGLCTNRFIQVTIVILVLVMAFCLISITTLYIMERQQPDTGLFGATNITSNTSDTSKSSFGVTTTVGPLVNLPIDGRIPIISPRCVREPGSCTVLCCPAPTTQKPPDDPNHNGHGGETTYTVKPGGDKNPNGHNEVLKPSVGPSVVGVVNVQAGPSYDLSNDTPKQSGPTVIIMNDPLQGRKRRSVSSLQEKAPLIIFELNKTIDNSYCTNDPCREGTGGNYTYDLPVSPYFGLNQITLVADIASSLDIFLCNHFEVNQCSTKDLDLRPTAHIAKGYTLPAGHYQITYYKFRVAAAELDTPYVCALNETEAGNTFAEYWLKFHRVQDESCPPSSLDGQQLPFDTNGKK